MLGASSFGEVRNGRDADLRVLSPEIDLAPENSVAVAWILPTVEGFEMFAEATIILGPDGGLPDVVDELDDHPIETLRIAYTA